MQVWSMQTGSGVVLRYEGRKRNATFKTTCGSSRALRYTTTARTPSCSFWSHSPCAHTEAFQVTPEDDSDRDADASNHEPVINSTPPAIATSTVTAVAASNDTCEVCFIEPHDRVALVPCGHTRFCSSCADAVASIPNGCPICRTPKASVLRVFMWQY